MACSGVDTTESLEGDGQREVSLLTVLSCFTSLNLLTNHAQLLIMITTHLFPSKHICYALGMLRAVLDLAMRTPIRCAVSSQLITAQRPGFCCF